MDRIEKLLNNSIAELLEWDRPDLARMAALALADYMIKKRRKNVRR